MLLHVTNGQAVIPLIRAAGIEGSIVPWDDVLHEGPVPAGLNRAALRDLRADFLATWVEEPREAIERSLHQRDDVLEDLRGVDEIVLWFEHDLYDQLQLIQVLDRLAADGPPVTAVPGHTYLTNGDAGALFAARRDVTSSQRLAASDAWDAFRSPDPRNVAHVIERIGDLPHLGPALQRHLEQFPSRRNGLSRTEQQTLEAVARGVSRLRDVYVAANHDREDAVFMGDLAFLFHIRSLVPRLLVLEDHTHVTPSAHVALTDDGRRVLAGEADRVRWCGIDRWLGGVHVAGEARIWRWDAARRELIADS